MVLHNGRISRDVHTGEPDFNYYRKKQWSLGYAFEHKPDSTWTLQNVRLMHSQLNNRSVWGAAGRQRSHHGSISRYAGIFQFNTAASTSTIRPRPNSAQAGCSIRCWPAWNTTASPPPTAKCWRRRRL